MGGSEIENLVERLIGRWHNFSRPSLWQVGLRVRALHKLLQAGPDCRAFEELTKNVDLTAQFVVGNRLDECFRGSSGMTVELPQLRSSCASSPQGFSFADYLAHQSNLLCLGGVETASS